MNFYGSNETATNTREKQSANFVSSHFQLSCLSYPNLFWYFDVFAFWRLLWIWLSLMLLILLWLWTWLLTATLLFCFLSVIFCSILNTIYSMPNASFEKLILLCLNFNFHFLLFKTLILLYLHFTLCFSYACIDKLHLFLVFSSHFKQFI